MKYFVDSSYIIALIKEDDSLHDKSLEFLDLLDSNDCYINDFIINEVITVIGNKIDLKTANLAYGLLNSLSKLIRFLILSDSIHVIILQSVKLNLVLNL